MSRPVRSQLFKALLVGGAIALFTLPAARAEIIRRSRNIPTDDPGRLAPSAPPVSTPPAASPPVEEASTPITRTAPTAEEELPPIVPEAPIETDDLAIDFEPLPPASPGGTTPSGSGQLSQAALDRWHIRNNVCNGALTPQELNSLFPSISSALVREVCR
ncbi:hypothetical protein [Synechococcus sp. PCC 7336]|uniref:hypothetical protein n=1 Tax=Synechococcus sp. PCC 7336 TaxID=195250 RepID=UPI0012EA8D06|nr:hypothetical protein [Synechococcus sp. PCC 7336]